MTATNMISLALAITCTPALALAASESRELSGFTEVQVSGGIDLELSQGDTFAVEVEVDEADLEDIITEVRGNTLHIHRDDMDRLSWRDFDDGLVRVTLPVLTELNASGGSDVDGQGTFAGEELEINVSGGSDTRLDVTVTTLDVRSSGGSDLRLTGTADEVDLRSSGGSDVDARNLTARAADLNASGGSDIDITVSESLIATASGGSDITYRGDPQERDVDASRDSDVTAR